MGCSAGVPQCPLEAQVQVIPSANGTLLAAKRGDVRTEKAKPLPTAAPGREREASEGRGFGDLIRGVNHVALIVRDVGDSLFFYTDVVGFRQIDRANFDRHGAWLAMGNIQLHLIKGIPHTHRGQHPRDLIVSHIALDVADVGAVLDRLRRLQLGEFKKLRWRQNVSVPTHQSSMEARFESDHTSAEGKLAQIFLEDPDGYWLEICNCGEEEERQAAFLAERRRAGSAARFRLRHAAALAVRTLRWARRARRRLASGEALALELARLARVAPGAADAKKLRCLRLRRNTYGDICQGFADEELRDALAQAGNHVPGAILVLKRQRRAEGQVYHPPSFLDEVGAVQHTSPFRMTASGGSNPWG